MSPLNSWRVAFAISTALAALSIILSTYLYVQVSDESDRRLEAVRQGQIQNCGIIGIPLQRAVRTAIAAQLFVLRHAAVVDRTISDRTHSLTARDRRLLLELRSLTPCTERYPPLAP